MWQYFRNLFCVCVCLCACVCVCVRVHVGGVFLEIKLVKLY